MKKKYYLLPIFLFITLLLYYKKNDLLSVNSVWKYQSVQDHFSNASADVIVAQSTQGEFTTIAVSCEIHDNNKNFLADLDTDIPFLRNFDNEDVPVDYRIDNNPIVHDYWRVNLGDNNDTLFKTNRSFLNYMRKYQTGSILYIHITASNSSIELPISGYKNSVYKIYNKCM